MSPVSKRRKPKKKSGNRRKSASAAPTGRLGVAAQVWEHGITGTGTANRRRNQPPPEWVKLKTAAVLADSGRFAEAASARELEAMIGAVFADAFAEDAEEFDPVWFPLFAMELIDGAAALAAEHAAGAGGASRLGPLFLLRGLESSTPEHYRRRAEAAARKVLRGLSDADHELIPDGLGKAPEPTGKSWTIANVYGDEFGIISAFSDPLDGTESFYLMSFDCSQFSHVSFAGDFATLDAAVEAWRGHVDGGESGVPVEVTAGDSLKFMAYADDPVEVPTGRPDPAIVAEYFRSARRLADLTARMSKDGIDIPAPEYLFKIELLDPVLDGFEEWLERRGIGFDQDAVFVIAEQYVHGVAPETAYSISPKRVDHGALLIADQYMPEDLDDVFKLLPEWFRFCGEQSGLEAGLIEAVIVAAPKSPEEAKQRDTDKVGA